ncbi:MAG: NAD(P)H-dependent oxidoreductase [Deltaproteobacteria bacterium]|nr:NAD(P)H-dependent oxidoreductase [Deltaproteobacteria bacterium]
MERSRGHPLLLACSPRQGGNCDTAMAIIRQGMGRVNKPAPPVTFLRDHAVSPCVSCGHCARHRLECPLFARDGSAPLFDALGHASSLVLAAPLYFYHVPAQLKALIDRSQPWWMARDVWGETPSSRRVAHIILIGGRSRGERLFEGALLTLRYWLDLFGFDLAEPLPLHDLDGHGALGQSGERSAQVARYAETIAASMPSAEA